MEAPNHVFEFEVETRLHHMNNLEPNEEYSEMPPLEWSPEDDFTSEQYLPRSPSYTPPPVALLSPPQNMTHSDQIFLNSVRILKSKKVGVTRT